MTTYLITGGAGSLGKEIVERLKNSTVRVLDIDEAGLSDLKEMYPETRCLYGDIRDINRVNLAMKNVDVCIHCAALKNINVTEYNLPELIYTNVSGTLNLILSAIEHNIKQFIFISSDKAVYPTTAYGTTKLMGENLVKWAGKIQKNTKFTIVRSGNFFKSKGNVFEVWEKQKSRGQTLTITSNSMARYFIDTGSVANIVIGLCGYTPGFNSTVIPKMKLCFITDELRKKYPNEQFKIIGIRDGEKSIEKLCTNEEHLIDYEAFSIINW